jgi:hypothetical protein
VSDQSKDGDRFLGAMSMHDKRVQLPFLLGIALPLFILCLLIFESLPCPWGSLTSYHHDCNQAAKKKNENKQVNYQYKIQINKKII